MKIFILLLCWMLCPGYHSAAKNRLDYAAYFEGILQAEHSLSNDDLSAALEAYIALFRNYDFVFARDAYNALQLAILSGQQARRDSLLVLCAESGAPGHVLLGNALVHSAYAGGDHHFRALFDKGHALYLGRIDTALRAEMQGRFKTEQASKGRSDYKSICTDNFNRILELAKAGRFPGEQTIGVDDALENGFVFPTLLHYPYAYVLLRNYLWKALHRGEVQPLSLIYLYGFNQTRTSVLYTSRIPVDTQHFNIRYNLPFGLQSGDKAAVDRARRAVWLPPLSREQRIEAVTRKRGIDFREGW